jgi:hypothetical protein
MNYKQASRQAKLSNYSDRSVQDLFNAEVLLEDEIRTEIKYKGMNAEQKHELMQDEYDEIQAENAVYDYYND